MIDYPFFSAKELRCKCGRCDGGEMNKFFMDKLFEMRMDLVFPFVVTSAFRCPDYNARISSSGREGPHTTGRAIDIKVYGNRASKLIEAAYRHGMFGVGHGGLGVKQNGAHTSRFIHIDDLFPHETPGPRPWVWTY